MAVRPIVVWPDPRLRAPTRAIPAVDDQVRALYRDMCDSMRAYDGVGLAAPQIGESVQMFVIASEVVGRGEGDPVAFINPEVTWVSPEKGRMEEGCLSFPGIYLDIERPRRAKVRAMGIDGEMFEVEGDALLGRALLHEHDHITGKLMLDFVGPLKKRTVKKKMERYSAEHGGGHTHGPDCDHSHEHA